MLGHHPIAGAPVADGGAPATVVVLPPAPPVPPIDPIPDPEFEKWLRELEKFPVTLYEVSVNVGGQERTRYLSNRAYGGGSADTPYLAVVTKDLELDESISYDGDAKLSVGDVTLGNLDGSLDSWLFDVWSNRKVAVYLGDQRWDRSSFRQVFAGVVADIVPGGDRTSLTLQFRDILQALNTSVTEDTMADGSTLRPVGLGEVPNFTPKLKNAATLEYEVNAGPIEDIIEARVDGKPREIVKNLALGSFNLTSAVGGGTLTCSFQGDKGDGIYRNRIAPLVQRLATAYGTASMRLTADDIDTAQFAAFDAACPQPVGLGLSERTNVLNACAQLASSKGAQLIPSRLAKLRLIQFAIPDSATAEIRPSSQVNQKLTPIGRPFSVAAGVKLGYCCNYTPQNNLQTSISADNKAMLALDWRTVNSVDEAVQAKYRLSAEPSTQKNTCLLDEADAQAECDRLLEVVSVPRLTFQFDGEPDTLMYQLGEARMLYNARYELENGKPALVTRIKANFGTLKTTVEVTI
jgi:hypothetical protein